MDASVALVPHQPGSAVERTADAPHMLSDTDPGLVAANTNAAAAMIDEKAAEMIARDADVRLAELAAEPVD